MHDIITTKEWGNAALRLQMGAEVSTAQSQQEREKADDSLKTHIQVSTTVVSW